MPPFLKQAVSRLYGSAVAWTLVFTLVRTAGNVLVLPLMLHKLTAEVLGLWYVFLALGGISSLIDMGFLPSMSRAAAYLWAGAHELREFGAAVVEVKDGGEAKPNFTLLADLTKTMRLYYFGVAALVTLVMAIFGTLWIVQKTAPLPHRGVLLVAWLIFLFGNLINITGSVWHPLLTGINDLRAAQQILTWGLIANYAITFSGLVAGAGLFAPVVGYLAMGILSRSMARRRFNLLTDAHRYRHDARLSGALLGALWPTAWRTGIVTLGIYATVNASTLICGAYFGLTTTASFGLSMQLALAALGIAAAFVLVKLPIIAQLHARGKLADISTIVFPRLRWFWLSFITLALSAVLFGDPVLRDLLHSKTPLLPKPLLIALFILAGLEGHHGLFRELAMTANRNPFARPVVISGCLIVLLSCFFAPRIGLWALILAPGLVQIAFNNWWTVLVGLRSFGASFDDYVSGLLSLPSNHGRN